MSELTSVPTVVIDARFLTVVLFPSYNNDTLVVPQDGITSCFKVVSGVLFVSCIVSPRALCDSVEIFVPPFTQVQKGEGQEGMMVDLRGEEVSFV
ncbi:MAG: hypothetical protein KC736_03650 [Candidatus Moranbacteria bacterium]|nr:hypothetical protein [Candidatus Moranbacteria bacterium]